MNDNETNLIAFPIQTGKGLADLDGGDLMAASRVVLTQYLNEVACGEAVLTDKIRMRIEVVNAIYRKCGYQTIDIDF
jgi:hypothetical protein